MDTNGLKMKTPLFWIGAKYQLPKFMVHGLQLQSMSVHCCSAMADLEVTIDGELTMKDHVAKLCQLFC